MNGRTESTAKLGPRAARTPPPPGHTGARSRRLRRIILGAVTALLVLTLLPIGWLVLQHLRPPMPALCRPLADVRVAREVRSSGVTSAGERRLFREITLVINQDDSLRIAVSVPEVPASRVGVDRTGADDGAFAPHSPPARDRASRDAWPAAAGDAEPLPVVLILGGLTKGRAALEYLPTHGRNVLIGYDYPYDEKLWYENARFFEVARIRRAVLSVPSQIVAVLQWVEAQPWADVDRLSLLGYSFGTLFVPATQRLAQESDVQLTSTVMAYGGVDIQLLLERNLNVRPGWLRGTLARLLAASIRPLEPEIHLPHLEGSFLLINGNADEKIPYSAALRMHQLTPEPKTVVELEAAHLHPRRRDLTAQIIDISQRWLVERGAVNPL